jgi:hypothetical protein
MLNLELMKSPAMPVAKTVSTSLLGFSLRDAEVRL